MAKNYTYEQIANDFSLWGEYVDQLATMSEDDFNAMTTAEKIEMQIELFGSE